jgi:hypothetical protein
VIISQHSEGSCGKDWLDHCILDPAVVRVASFEYLQFSLRPSHIYKEMGLRKRKENK